MEIGGILTYEGCNFFRQKLILATLSGKPVRVKNIRVTSEEPGLKDYEASFIRLIDCISNGSRIEVNETGTAVLYKPGVLVGGHLEHSCPNQRGIGYFLEPLFMLAPFCKIPLNITMKGVTNNKLDPSVDMIRSTLLPVLKKFLVVDDGLSLKMIKRGLPPSGGGVVTFTCPVRRTLKPFQWEESGKIKRIRGVAYTSRVTPTVANRMLDAAKGEFLKFLTDVYLAVDNAKGSSPGFGLCAVAETNMGSFMCAEAISNSPGEDAEAKLPEDVGREAAWRLLEEIYRGGCVDTLSQSLVLLFMALAPKDVSKIVLGPIAPYTMHFLRHLRDFFQVTFKIDEYKEKNFSFSDEVSEARTGASKLLLTCIGVGYSNISKGQT
ncbi:RNA 3'-terminal phosphate cyclase-like protein [Homarus americanus]|uniref:RNA 3'-terminal phosphate cyclase-like protein n=1 Tax=Homarus americanus TaxID=6706 RepID=UPI001C458AE9|nr:RNA 3'-terminal phosphate cyclase-like protein [Homarus americanus]